MRNIINILENFKLNSLYPDNIDVDSLLNFIIDIHGNEEDYVEGDLTTRLYRFREYVLQDIPLSDINIKEWAIHDETVADYANRPVTADFPPIVYDSVRKSIIDGTHRANAFAISGKTTIPAYVGTRANRNAGPDKISPAIIIRGSRPTPTGWEFYTGLNREIRWKRDW